MRVGIDVGLQGAIAFLEDDLSFLDVFDMPLMKAASGKNEVDPAALTDIFEKMLLTRDDYEKTTVNLERVSARPSQGVTSMFNFGESSGVVRGVLGALRLRTERVTPPVWKKQCNMIGRPKDDCRVLAKSLYPQASLARVKDSGRADAILIARYTK